MTAQAKLHELEIAHRPPKTWAQLLHALLFSVVFNIGCFMINGFQFIVLLPLKFIPLSSVQELYDAGIRYSKGAFGTLLVLVTQLFAPTTLVISFEHDGPGALSQEDAERMLMRDERGRIVGLNLPQKAVLIANHQVYVDWWYAWCLTYLAGTHRDVFIVLKKSLKWVPILGWGMQFFDFIFLARSWASDRLHLAKSLARLGQRAERKDIPLTFILYPEGTLVSKDTRPVSKKYAEKMGIADMQHTLLPRSTGLHYSLRSLAPRIPSLKLVDITVAYPGIPAFGYGQSYYTLRSIFLDGIPPPQVHMHIRVFDVTHDVPIGDVSISDLQAVPNGNGVSNSNGDAHPATNGQTHTTANGHAKTASTTSTASTASASSEIEIPETERVAFDRWLRALWEAKDADMGRYLKTGSFVADAAQRVEVPVAVKRPRDVPDAFCFFVPAVCAYIVAKLR